MYEAWGGPQKLVLTINGPVRSLARPACGWLGGMAGKHYKFLNTNKPYNMTHQLIDGLHIAIITTTSPRFGGSMLASEVLAVAMQRGIRAILATFDHGHRYAQIGRALYRLKMPWGKDTDISKHYTSYDISQLFDEARATHKLVIIDVPAGFNLSHPMFEVLSESGISDASAIAALVPVMADDDGTTGAAMAMRTLAIAGINFDRGLICERGFNRESARTNLCRLPNYPLWRTGCLSGRAVELIEQEVERVVNPSLYDLPRLLDIQTNDSLSVLDREALQQAIAHFDAAAKVISQTILDPICKRIQ